MGLGARGFVEACRQDDVRENVEPVPLLRPDAAVVVGLWVGPVGVDRVLVGVGEAAVKVDCHTHKV